MDSQLLIRNEIVIMVFYLIWFLVIKYNLKITYNKWNMVGLLCFGSIMNVITVITGITPMSGFHLKIDISTININLINGIGEMLNEGMFGVYNIVGNVLLFMPVGFLVPLICNRYNSFLKVTLFGFLISLFVECWQLFLFRGSDVVDLVLNTLGTMLGYFIYCLCKKMFFRFVMKFSSEQYSLQKIEEAGTVFSAIVPIVIAISLGFLDRVIYGI
jgi:glycopeptide antibiotics resistance protein